MEEEYRNNSEHKKANMPDVLNGGVRRHKKSALKSAMGLGDVSSVGSYAVMDVIIPSIKRAISDIVCNGIRMLLGDPNRGRYSPDDPDRRPNYRAYYSDRREEPRREFRRELDNLDDLEFQGRGRAEWALQQLQDLCETNGYVEAGRLFDLCHQDCPYTYWDYGWTNLDDVRVLRGRDDWYFLDLPVPRYIGNRR